SGRARWSSTAAAVPLVQAGPALVALTEHGRLVLLDAASGKPYAKCPAIRGVTIAIANSVFTQSTASGSTLDGHGRLSWPWQPSPVRGAPPPAGKPTGPPQSDSGTYEIDVAGCKATPGPPLPGVFDNRSEPGKSIGVVKLVDGSETQLVR